MEGARRIRIFFNGRQVSKIRVPVSFNDLLIAIRKLQQPESAIVEIEDLTQRFRISSNEEYQESLRKLKGNELTLNLKTLNQSQKSKEILKLEGKYSSEEKKTSQRESIRRSEVPEEDCIDDPADQSSSPILPLVRNPDLPLPRKRRGKDHFSTSSKHLKTSEIEKVQNQDKSTSSQSKNPHHSKQPKPSNPPNINKIDILTSFSCIPAEGELKLIDSSTSNSITISEDSIARSSRLLLTPEGVLITGGSSSPSQAMLVNKNYSISTLQPMNHKRFWHCMGYIDGCPAVVGGAEKSTIPKVFSSTVEIYKDNNWKKYPNTNYARASASMSWDNQSVYIIGGVTTDGVSNTMVNFIEKWDNDKWVVLNVVIPTSLISCGTLPKGKNEIFIFGGKKSGGLQNNKRFFLNLDDGQVQDEEDLDSQSKFTYGQEVKKIGNLLKVCDYQGQVFELDYKDDQDNKDNYYNSV